MSARDQFEIHLTVEAAQAAAGADALSRFAESEGMQLLHIELPRGAVTAQPMLSWRRDGVLADCLAQIDAIEQALADQDIRVVRAKVEAAPSNVGVPQAEDACPPGTYFESHLKLLVEDDAALSAITDIAIAHGAHVSRNARRTREDGRQERFVTLRSVDGGLPGMKMRLQALQDALTPMVRAVLDTEIEFVVHDSNRALDAGWLPGEMA